MPCIVGVLEISVINICAYSGGAGWLNRVENVDWDFPQLKIGWNPELGAVLEVCGWLSEESVKPPDDCDLESILVVCVASRRALIVELALKQFSTRRETPTNMSCVGLPWIPSSMRPSKASHRYGFVFNASVYESTARFESPEARCRWPIRHKTAPISGKWFRVVLLWSSTMQWG